MFQIQLAAHFTKFLQLLDDSLLFLGNHSLVGQHAALLSNHLTNHVVGMKPQGMTSGKFATK